MTFAETENFEPSRELMCAECLGLGHAVLFEPEQGQCECIVNEEEELHA